MIFKILGYYNQGLNFFFNVTILYTFLNVIINKFITQMEKSLLLSGLDVETVTQQKNESV